MARSLYQDTFNLSTPFSAVLSDKGDGTGVVNITSAGTALNGAGATNATPIVITADAHGKANGDIVALYGVAGNPAANVVGIVASQTTNTFALTNLSGANVAGNGAYTSGGVVYPAFCYRVPASKAAIINRFSLYASDTTNEASKYIGVTALTNGITVEVWRTAALLETLTPKAVTAFSDWGLWGGVNVTFAGVDADAENGAFASGSPVSGGALVLQADDVLVLRVRDNSLSGLLSHRAAISGYLAPV